MKLFKASRKSKAPVLIKNLEKITKISVLRIEKEDYLSAMEDLKWIEDNFISLLKLKDSDFPKFKSIFDPENKYKKVDFESVDWSKVDFSKVKIVRMHEKLTEEDKRYRKRYTLPKPPASNDILPKYVEVIFSIWNKAEEKKQFNIQKQCTYVFANWIGVLDRFTDEHIAFSIVIKYFLESLTGLNWSLLQIKGEELHPLFRFLSFNIYLEKIFDEELNRKNSVLYFQFLFENVYLSVSTGRSEVAKAFIERCIDRSFSPSIRLGAYAELHKLLHDRQRSLNYQYTEIQTQLNRITEFGFTSVKYLLTEEEYSLWRTSFKEYLTGIENQNAFSSEINNKISEIEEVAFKYLNFNRLQIVVIKILTYCLFKNNSEVINHTFEFNQPGDSRAIFSNEEIVPDSLSEILNYLTFSFSIENEMLRYWEGHHGIESYLEKCFLILFYRHNPRKRYYTEDTASIVGEFCSVRLRNDSTSISSLKSGIDNLLKILQFNVERKTAFSETYLKKEQRVNELIQMLELVSATCQTKLDELQITSEIKDSTKVNFLQSCVTQYEKNNYLYRLFTKYSKVDSALPANLYYINPGVNELHDRVAFIENWHIPYYGSIESIGNGIAERENSLGLSAIRQLTKPGPAAKIAEYQIPKIIRQANIPGIKIVIASNIYFESILREEKDYVPASDIADNDIEGFFVGKLGEAMIYNIYDRVFDNKQMIIISSDSILHVLEQTTGQGQGFTTYGSFDCKFIDFAYNDVERNSFLDNPPQWLKDQVSEREQQEAFLKTKVWIQIQKGIYFHTTGKNDYQFFEVN